MMVPFTSLECQPLARRPLAASGWPEVWVEVARDGELGCGAARGLSMVGLEVLWFGRLLLWWSGVKEVDFAHYA